MSTTELAKTITVLLKANEHQKAAELYHADDVVSYEAMDGPMAELHGKDAVRQKGEWWYANHEIHEVAVTGPYVNGDSFAVRFAIDVTFKGTGERMSMEEIGVYTVADGKVVSERFFPLTA